MKKVLITSGGTKEYIDGVRVLTNISSGKLGSMIAMLFADYEYEVYFVYVRGSEQPEDFAFSSNYINYYEVTDVKSVYEIMEELVPEMDVVIHPMAVSDFGFKPISTKLKSDDTESFIESMRERIFKNPKILSHIKEWNPNCFLISFKFEDGLTHEELVRIASESQERNGSDIVICNDKKEMNDNKEHIAYFIENGKEIYKAFGKIDISETILHIVQNK